MLRGFVLVCIGCVLIGVGLSMGGRPDFLDRHFFPEGRRQWEKSWGYENKSEGGADMKVTAIKLVEEKLGPDIREMDISLKAARVIIRSGTEPSLRIESGEKSTIEYTITDDSLRIRERDWNSVFSFGNKSENVLVEIVVSDVRTINRLNVSLGAGTLSVESLAVESFQLKQGAGECVISDLRAERASVSAGAGDYRIERAKLGEALIETGVGRFVYTGQLEKQAVISTGIGEVNLRLEGTVNDYRIGYTRGIGDIRIDGISYAGIGSGAAGNLNAEKTIEVTTGIGAVKIDFD